VWITLMSTNTTRRITSCSHASTKSSTLQLAASFSPSSTATRVITRSLLRKKFRSRQCSSPRLEHMHIQPYPLGSRMQEPPNSGPSNCACLISYIATLKPTWMTLSSRPDPTTSLSLISRKPSTAFASFDGYLTQPNASSASTRKATWFHRSHRGIEANSEKITAITAMDAPRTIKDV
jgi:hypothetical protein